MLAASGCADDAAVTTPEGSTTTSAPIATTPEQGPEVPAGFPIPIMAGGVTESAFATEVTLIYPEADSDRLIDFYDEFAANNSGTAHDMFVGREWDVQGARISVTPVDPATHPNRPHGVVLFIRLP